MGDVAWNSREIYSAKKTLHVGAPLSLRRADPDAGARSERRIFIRPGERKTQTSWRRQNKNIFISGLFLIIGSLADEQVQRPCWKLPFQRLAQSEETENMTDSGQTERPEE